jgi:hypothetical protein
MNTEPASAGPTSTDSGAKLHRDLARIGWIAPLLAILVSLGLAAAKVPLDSKLRAIPSVFIVIGGITAIVALFGVSKHGRPGILVPGALGLLLNAILFTGAMVMQRQLQSAVRPGAPDPFFDYPGLWASAPVSQCQISFASIHDESASSRTFNDWLSNSVSIVSIAVDNTRGTNTVTLEPSSVHLVLADRTTLAGLPTELVLAMVRTNQAKLAQLLTGPIVVPVGQQKLEGSAFFPRGTDYSRAVGVGVKINGKDYFIPGKFLSPQEKKQLAAAAPTAK